MHVPNYQDHHGCFSLSIFCTLHKIDKSYPIFQPLEEGPEKLKEGIGSHTITLYSSRFQKNSLNVASWISLRIPPLYIETFLPYH